MSDAGKDGGAVRLKCCSFKYLRSEFVLGVAAVAVFGSVAAGQALPPVPVPAQNPITEPKRVLGKILFWDEQFSSDNTMACATCHTPDRGGADGRRVRHPGPDGLFNSPDDVFGSPGVIRSDTQNNYVPHARFGLAPQVTARSANPVILAAYAGELFWDGRARPTFINPQTGQVSISVGGALESQSVDPPLSDVEMAHSGRDWDQITAKLAKARPLALATQVPPDASVAVQTWKTYPKLFEQAFGDDAITAERVAFALATYQRTLIADDTPWDRFNAGQTNAMTPAQVQGFQAFIGSSCAVCHQPPLFTNQTFRNIGLRPPSEDLGRQLVTGNPADRGRFKVPHLRNVGLRNSFMHNGQFTNLTDVIRFYARAPGAAPQFPDNRDPVMLQINVPPQAALVIEDFLTNALTDARVAARVFPFDRPTLYRDRPEDQPVVLGGGSPGSGGFVPRLISASPGLVGDTAFRIGLERAAGGATARLIVSSVPPVAGRLTAGEEIGPMAAGGTGPGNGFATARWAIPNNPTLDGASVYMQWAVDDAGAAGGRAHSPVVRYRLFCGSAGCKPCTADWNDDSRVSSADVTSYIAAWFTDLATGGFTSDVSGDLTVNSQDVSRFFAVWFASLASGC